MSTTLRDPPPASRPRIFLASSVEGQPIARLIQETLFAEADCVLWSDPGVFEAGEVTIESLLKALDLFSYAVVVLTPDDRTTLRGLEVEAPRDNLIYELGLFAGRYGRDSVFMVMPLESSLHLPSDLLGVNACRYKLRAGAEPRYDVSSACSQILRAVRRREKLKRRESFFPDHESEFWDGLADVVVIVFGVEGTGGAGEHPRLSLRDLEAAQAISTFLARRYPRKTVLTLPASAAGWSRNLAADTDLVLIGGFVSNEAFHHHQSVYRGAFRLKMGRLCRFAGQRVYHVGFDRLPPGTTPPPRGAPEAIDVFPSEHVSRDYALVFNVREEIYGAERRIIGIGGIKGNGTRGAARCLTRAAVNVDTLNPLLGAGLGEGDALYLVIESDIAGDAVSRTRIVEATLNGRSLLDLGDSWQPCELGRPCLGCTFGEGGGSELRAVVFDLDDTLIPTFDLLIAPLERAAAAAMRSEQGDLPPEDRLAERLVELRRTHPDEIESRLRSELPALSEAALEARHRVLSEVQLEPLAIEPEVRRLLEVMSAHYELHLLTAGDPALQDRKIEKVGIRRFFRSVLVTAAGSERDKKVALEELLAAHGYARDEVLVVGNRLDHEIEAGIRLGLPTVWVRRGEGCKLSPAAGSAGPGEIIGDLRELPSALEQERLRRAPG